VLAVDLGGTKTATAMVDEVGTVLDRCKEPALHDAGETAALVAGRAAGAEAIGVIVPGIYTPASGMAWAPNLWGMAEVPLLEEIRTRTSLPVVISDDRAGAVVGERWMGVARGLADVVFVAIGTGIGVGIVSGGKVLRGAHGIAGAAGWWALSRDWSEDYRATGCWETEAAGPALERGASLEVIAEFTAMGVANLISLLDPQMVVLGGGVLQAEYPLVEEVRRRAERWAQPVAFRCVRIEKTALGEDAGLLGAAKMALDRKEEHVG
jgi:glucokinase